MIKTWTYFILATSLLLMILQKEHESCKLDKYYHRETHFNLSQFKMAKAKVSQRELELLEVWESILTGKSAPVSKWIKQQYAKLGLNHLFTPSGFHLSTLTTPLFHIVNKKFQLLILILLSVSAFIFNVPSALKRMTLVKLNQKFMGLKLGFLIAIIMDLVTGGSNSFLSLTYSFLFLGIIYSGEKKIWIIILFFIGQVMISFSQEILISPLVLIFSPILNLFFSLAMPLLFLLSFPLYEWQLKIGLMILKILQKIVEITASCVDACPQFLPDFVVILILIGILRANKKIIIFSLVLFSNGLNLDLQKYPSFSYYEFVPSGQVININDPKMYFYDGTCKRELIRGFWWEKCSPKRRGSNIKKLKKLSYL